MDYQLIIEFWFSEIEPAAWWRKDDSFDELIRQRFLPLHQAACRCECESWRDQPLGRLAEIIARAVFQSRQRVELLHTGSQAPDHPIHPAIVETRYLKSFLCRVVCE